MPTVDEPLIKSNDDGMPLLIGGDEDNVFDMELHIWADHNGFVLDANRCRWTDIVSMAEIALCFQGDMLVFLVAWKSAVYLRNNLSSCRSNQRANDLSCGRVFPRRGKYGLGTSHA